MKNRGVNQSMDLRPPKPLTLNEDSAEDIRQGVDDSEVVIDDVVRTNRPKLPFLGKLDETSMGSTTYGRSTYKGGVYPNKTIDPRDYCRRSYQSA